MTAPLPCEHCQHPPTFKHVEQQQEPYRGLWMAIVARVTDLHPDIPIYKRDLDRWTVELWEEQPRGAEAFALATTRYGREEEQGR